MKMTSSAWPGNRESSDYLLIYSDDELQEAIRLARVSGGKRTVRINLHMKSAGLRPQGCCGQIMACADAAKTNGMS